MRRHQLSRPTFAAPGRVSLSKARTPQRASRRRSHAKRRSPARPGGLRSVESLEERCFLAASPVAASAAGVFHESGDMQQAVFQYTFEGTPTVEEVNGGTLVTLDGESTWISTGDAVVPVRSSTILLPPGTSIVSVSVTYLDEGVVLGQGAVSLLTAPAAVSSDTSLDEVDWSTWTETLTTSLTEADAVQYVNQTLAGYSLGALSIFPVEYDAATGALIYHSQLSVTITTSAADSTDTVTLRDSGEDAQRVAALVSNTAELAAYQAIASSASSTATASAPAASLGQADYVVITSKALAPAFESLVAEKKSRGLTAMIVTTEYIYAHYTGTENHDNADKIRDYIADAYAYQGTTYVLLGGDTDVVPVRGVYGKVGSIVATDIACDLYYAALDGTWDGDDDGVWGEANDGARGGDVDLLAEVYIGRASVSTIAEASNFVAKTIDYTTTAQSNTTTIVVAGEQLDSQTQGSVSGEEIENESVPAGYTVIELYDTAGSKWTSQQLIDVLNDSPNLVEHLGHSSDTCNARLSVSDVAGLTNTDYYFLYSQGCDGGSFDTQDVCIGEAQIVSKGGAVAVVMNSRYGWYVPGSDPGGSHDFAACFWEAVLKENVAQLGEALEHSKEANLFRVSSTGMARWSYMELNLLGDPELALQVGSSAPDGASGQIQGKVYEDADADGVQDSGEEGVAEQNVYLDSNGNGQLDQNVVTTVSSSTTQSIPDNGTLTATLTVSGVATIADLNVTLNISHTYDSDLDVYLISPAGTKILLFSNVGDWGQNFTNLTLDDEAATSIDAASAPFKGTFQAQGWLSLVDGENPNGTWTLVVSDTSACDTGKLKGWSLTFTSTEASTQTAADGSYRFSGLADGAYQVRLAGASGSTAGGASDLVQRATIADGATVRGVNFALARNVTPKATDLGAVDYLELSNVTLAAGKTWYCVSATHSGYLTIETTALASSTNVQLLLYDQGQAALGTLDASSGRIDLDVEAGQVYYFSLTGSGSVDVCLANLIRQDGDTVTIDGTSGDDTLTISVGSSYQINVNGVAYTFDRADVNEIRFDGGAGSDKVAITGSTGDETARLYAGSACLTGSGYRIDVANAESIAISGGGGCDLAYLYDSSGDDTFTADPTFDRMAGTGYDNRADGFDKVYAYSSTGEDTAQISDSAGNDTFIADPSYGQLSGTGYAIRVEGFDAVYACATTGYDTAYLYDSAGNDTFLATSQYGRLYGAGFLLRAKFFDAVYAYATAGGDDTATFCDSSGNDAFYATPAYARLANDKVFCRAQSFESVYAVSTGGKDTAQLYDSSGNDLFVASATGATLSGGGFKLQVSGFYSVQAYATAGGYDTAQLYDSSGNDVFVATSQRGKMSGSGYLLRADYFDAVHGYATAGGDDVAYLHGTSGSDVFLATSTYSRMTGTTYLTRAQFFETVYGEGGGGTDLATFKDSSGNERVDAARDWLKMAYASAVVQALDFDTIRASAYAGGTNTKHVEAVNYLLQMLGVWKSV